MQRKHMVFKFEVLVPETREEDVAAGTHLGQNMYSHIAFQVYSMMVDHGMKGEDVSNVIINAQMTCMSYVMSAIIASLNGEKMTEELLEKRMQPILASVMRSMQGIMADYVNNVTMTVRERIVEDEDREGDGGDDPEKNTG